MNKPFDKLCIPSILAIASFLASACTDPNPGYLTGTAEERNQSANAGDVSGNIGPASSDSETESSSSETEIESSSSESSTGKDPSIIPIDPGDGHSGAPSGRPDSSIHIIGAPSSSSQSYIIVNPSSSSKSEPIGNPDNNLLSIYVYKTGMPKITFAESVFGFNKTYEECNPSEKTCSEDNSKTAEFRILGLHKITSEDFDHIKPIFPLTTEKFGNKLKEVYTEGCSVYVLNIKESSPAWHVLTSITSDSLTVENIFDNCDYEQRPFDLYVGFLFSFCGELTDQTKIVMNTTPNGSNQCGLVSYEELYRQR